MHQGIKGDRPTELMHRQRDSHPRVSPTKEHTPSSPLSEQRRQTERERERAMTHDYEGGDSRREGDRKQEPFSFALAITRSIHLGNGTATPLVLSCTSITLRDARGKEGGKREDAALVAQQSHASQSLCLVVASHFVRSASDSESEIKGPVLESGISLSLSFFFSFLRDSRNHPSNLIDPRISRTSRDRC